MRFGLAIASLLLAGILLILGIGQRTFLAGPREIVYPVSLPASVEYAVIPTTELEAVPGQANIEVGGSEGFAAIGSAIDVEAWVAPSDHVVATADTEAKELTGGLVTAQQSEPEEDEAKPEDPGAAESTEDSGTEDASEEAVEAPAFDPRGSDLWLETQDGVGRMPVSAVANQSLIVQVPAGEKVSVVWVQDLRTPLAGPLMVAGGLFALLGLVLYLLAVDHDRRGLGPRRGRRGPLPGIRGWLGGGGKREKDGKEPAQSRPAPTERRALRPLAVPALGLAAVLALSGCSASYWPDFSQQEAPETEEVDANGSNLAPVPVTQAQIDRIITDVANIAAESDDALDAETLKERFAGDALAQRAANYKIRSSVSDYEVTLPRITDEHLGYELVQSTDGWPRTLFVTVASEIPGEKDAQGDGADDSGEASGDETTGAAPAASPSLALVLTQPSPHENYRVERLFALRGGIKMPTAAPVEEGTALLADDLQTLALPPGEVGAAYAAILIGGTESENAELFDTEGDTMIAKSGAAWVAAAKQAASEAGTDVAYSVTAEQSSAPVVSLSTGVGGALVATTVLESRVEKQAGDYQPKAVGAFEALSGLSGRQEQMVSVVAHQLLFFVPSATSGEKIQLLGYTTELVEAKN